MGRHKSKPNPGRNIRLADQIQKDLAILVQREVDSARAGLVTLTGVDLSADYAHAKVYFTVMGAEPDAASAALNEKAGWLHSLLFKLLHIHTVPTLHFLHDDQLARGIALSQLIDQVNRPAPNAFAPSIPDDPDEQP
jgi:ribosome-binding factor A